MTKEILNILNNILYWETCPDDYKEIIKKYLVSEKKKQALNKHFVSVSLPTDEQIQDWVCNEFKITGLDFDEDIRTQYGYLPDYFKKFAEWLQSNDR